MHSRVSIDKVQYRFNASVQVHTHRLVHSSRIHCIDYRRFPCTYIVSLGLELPGVVRTAIQLFDEFAVAVHAGEGPGAGVQDEGTAAVVAPVAGQAVGRVR